MSLEDRDWYREDYRRRSSLPDSITHRRRFFPRVVGLPTKISRNRFRFLCWILFLILIGYILKRFA